MESEEGLVPVYCGLTPIFGNFAFRSSWLNSAIELTRSRWKVRTFDNKLRRFILSHWPVKAQVKSIIRRLDREGVGIKVLGIIYLLGPTIIF